MGKCFRKDKNKELKGAAVCLLSSRSCVLVLLFNCFTLLLCRRRFARWSQSLVGVMWGHPEDRCVSVERGWDGFILKTPFKSVCHRTPVDCANVTNTLNTVPAKETGKNVFWMRWDGGSREKNSLGTFAKLAREPHFSTLPPREPHLQKRATLTHTPPKFHHSFSNHPWKTMISRKKLRKRWKLLSLGFG